MKRVIIILLWASMLIGAGFLSGRLSLPVTPLKADPDFGPGGTRALRTAEYDIELQNTVDAVLARIEKASLEIFSAAKHSPPPLTDGSAAELEVRLGYALPGQLKAFLKSKHTNRIPWSKIWSDWYIHNTDDIYQWSIGEYLSWCDPEGAMPSVENGEWAPGMILFMSNAYEYFAINIETGHLSIIDSESRERLVLPTTVGTEGRRGFDLQSKSLLIWLENTASRLEEKNYINNVDEFLFKHENGSETDSPGESNFE